MHILFTHLNTEVEEVFRWFLKWYVLHSGVKLLARGLKCKGFYEDKFDRKDKKKFCHTNLYSFFQTLYLTLKYMMKYKLIAPLMSRKHNVNDTI